MEETATKAPELTEEQKKQKEAQEEMCKFVGIDTYDANTKFIDVRFNDGQARTCLIFGAFGMHGRMVGEYSTTVHNERLAIDEKKEGEYDITLSCKREFVYYVRTRRQKREDQDGHLWELFIKHPEGDITVTGLSEEKALLFKKMIWTWMIFHNPAIQQAQH